MSTTKPPRRNSGSILKVALNAQVSTATVSRVLNRSGTVAPATADHVMRCAEALGYQLPQRRRQRSSRSEGDPTTAAALSVKRIAIIALGRPNSRWLEAPVMARAVLGTSRAAQAQGCDVMLHEMDDIQEIGPFLRKGEIDGAVVWLSSGLTPDALESLGRRMPIVRAMGDQRGPLSVDHVGPNNRLVGHLAHSHLLAQGCQEMVFLSIDTPHWELMHTRAQGFFEAAQKHSRPGRAVVVARDGSKPTYMGAADITSCLTNDAAAESILKNKSRPVGVFAARDAEATGIYRLLEARGAVLDRDVIVVSCDNDPAWLSGLHPRPASIDLQSEEIGRRAFMQLLERIRRPHDPLVQILVNPMLRVPEEAVETQQPALPTSAELAGTN